MSEHLLPAEPRILSLAAPPPHTPTHLPLLDAAPGCSPLNWVVTLQPDVTGDALRDDGALDAALARPEAWRPLPAAWLLPAGPGGIDLRQGTNGHGETGVTLAGLLRVDVEWLCRVHLDRLRADMRIAGVWVADGTFLRLAPGVWPVAVVADTRQDYPWDRLVLAPRWTPCTQTDIERWHARKLQGHARAQRARGAHWEHAVEILPHTAIGTEGFIRVARSAQGFWWFVDADGRPFYYQGVTSINRTGTQGERRAQPGPYAETVDRAYGDGASPEPFARACLDRLRAWGFNGLGAWTTPEFAGREGFFLTDIVEFNQGFPRLRRAGFVDVFDPAWERWADARARDICGPQREDRRLVGYFTENEIGFGGVGTMTYDLTGNPVPGTARPALLHLCLAETPEAAAHRRAEAFVLERHGTWKRAARAWKVAVAAAADVRALDARGDVLCGPGFTADAEAFAALFAETFFRTAALAIRRHDPNHLVLGCRWAGPPQPHILAAEQRWTDVLSLNNYQEVLYERVEEYANALGLPVLIGEYCWSDDAHMTIRQPFEPRVGLIAPERMAIAGAQSLRRLARHPNVVGWTWDRWVAENRLQSPRNCGLVDTADRVQPWNVEPLALLTAGLPLERVRASGETPAPPDVTDADLTLVLQNAVVSADPLRRTRLVCGVRLRHGRAERELRGYGLVGTARGRCRAAPHGAALRLRIAAAFEPEVFPRGSGHVDLRVVLDSQTGPFLRGTYTGRCNGIAVHGTATGWTKETEGDATA